jgi:acyl-coenzyme A thioesterase PaaI-like protein
MDSAAMTGRLTSASEFMRVLEIEFDEHGPTRVTGSVAADERHHQPWGLVHGGLYTTVIETFATTGAFEAVKDRGMQAVGVSNLTDFIVLIGAAGWRSRPPRSTRGERSNCGRSRSDGPRIAR